MLRYLLGQGDHPVYNGTQRLLEITSDTALWCLSGLPPVHLRWILVPLQSVLLGDPGGPYAGLRGGDPLLATDWYYKTLPTFCDAIALVRQLLWHHMESFSKFLPPPDIVKIPRTLLSRRVGTACHAG